MRIPLDREMIDFFDRHEGIDVYFALARGIAAAYAENREVTGIKVEQLARAYRGIFCTLGFVVAYAWLYVIWAWSR